MICSGIIIDSIVRDMKDYNLILRNKFVLNI